MSSSFVKDCSDSSRSGSTSASKTVIIIVNNETGNGPIYENDLQNILATHGAGPSSEISVVQMGGANGGSISSDLVSSLNNDPGVANAVTNEGISVPLNFPIDSYPTIPWDGSNIDGYTELPIDEDIYKRIESVLDTDEAKEILGEPLIDNIVNNPDDLVDSFEQMLSDQSDDVNYKNEASTSKSPQKRSTPKRRSQRQMDKAERDEMIKILAENQKMLQEERETLRKAKEEAERLQQSANELSSNAEESNDEVDETILASSQMKNKGNKNSKIIISETNSDSGQMHDALKPSLGKPRVVKSSKSCRNKLVKVAASPLPDNNNVPQEMNIRKLSVKIKKLNTKDIIETSHEEKSCSATNDKVVAPSNQDPIQSSSSLTKSLPSMMTNLDQDEKKGSNVLPVEENKKVNVLNAISKPSDNNLILSEGNLKPCDDNMKPSGGSLSDQCASEINIDQLMPTNHFSDETSIGPSKLKSAKRRTIKVIYPVEGKCVKDLIKNPVTVVSVSPPLMPMSQPGAKKKKLSFENQLNTGNLALSNKPVELPDRGSPKSPLQLTPSISKSLMNYKIPLKKLSAKKSLLDNAKDLPLNNKNPNKSSPNQIKSPKSLKRNISSTTPVNDALNPKVSLSNLKNTKYIKDTFTTLTCDSTSHKTVTSKGPAKDSLPVDKGSTPFTEPRRAFKQTLAHVVDDKAADSSSVVQNSNSDICNKSNVSSLQDGRHSCKPVDRNNVKQQLYNVSNNVERSDDKLKKNIFPPHKIKMANKNDDNKDTIGAQSVRRSVRPIKKTKFADGMMALEDHPSSSSDEQDFSHDEINNKSDVELVAIESSASSDENEEIEEEEEGSEIDDDPERLWCICQRPHNNRFMICCDRCEDWFHGACVGITKLMGQQMEEQEREWICPNCKKAEKAIKGVMSPVEEVTSPPIKKIRVKGFHESKEIKTTKKVGSKESKENKSSEPRVLVYHKSSGVVLSGSDGPKLSEIADWLYRNQEYTVINPELMNHIIKDKETGIQRIPLVKLGLKKKPKKSFQNRMDSSTPKSTIQTKNSKTHRTTKLIDAIETETPKKAKLHSTNKLVKESDSTHSSPKNFYAKEKIRRRSSEMVNDDDSYSHKKPKEPKKIPVSKTPEVDRVKMKSETQKYRTSAQNKLHNTLMNRKSEGPPDDFKELSSDDIKKISADIEEQLFLLFNKDVGFKYKNRYRSIIFNLGDMKNSGLYRKVLNGTFSPSKLVQMTSEQLANKELAEWRKGEEKKELEAIQKHELERIAMGNQYIMKSHKGEIAIEKDSQDYLGSKSKDAESLINLSSSNTGELLLNASEVEEDEAQINHKNHIYDPNCKICSASEDLKLTKEEMELKEKLSKESKKRERRESESHRLKDRRSSSSHKHKRKHKRRHSSSSERSRSKDLKNSKDRKDSKDHSDSKDHHRHHHKDRRSSKDHHRRDSDYKKRRHSSSKESRRDTELKSSSHKQDKSEAKVSTSEDVVFLPDTQTNRSPIDVEPTSTTVIGTPSNGTNASPLASLAFPEELDSSVRSPLTPEINYPGGVDYSPDNSPVTPPLPTEGGDFSPATPPLPDDDPQTPPPIADVRPVQMPVWKGAINMVDVATFSVAAFEVSGKALFFKGDVPLTVEVVGRINPDTVWSYIAQQRKGGTKEILVVRFQPSSEEEKVSYIALYSYLSNKKRYGVVGNCEKAIKDFYIIPLASHQPIPQVLLPLDGPGFEESRPHMLIGVVVRTKHKKYYDPQLETWVHNGASTIAHTRTSIDEDEEVESYTPPPSFGRDVKSSDDLNTGPFVEESVTNAVDSPISDRTTAEEDQERIDRETMLAELNRQIERDRKELSEMQKKVDETTEEQLPLTSTEASLDKSGSTSPSEESDNLPLFNISLPSNLQEILNNIKKKEDAIKEKEDEIKRRLSLPSEAILPSTKDVDLRLLLHSNKDPLSLGQDQDMRVFTRQGPLPPKEHQRHKDPRVKELEKGSSLKSMSDADLLAKALEMEEAPKPIAPPPNFQRSHPNQPPMQIPPVPLQRPLLPPPMHGSIHPPQGPMQPPPMHGPMQPPMQGPMQPLPMQGPMQPLPMQGPMQQPPMQGPMQQPPMQGPMQPPMPHHIQGSMPHPRMPPFGAPPAPRVPSFPPRMHRGPMPNIEPPFMINRLPPPRRDDWNQSWDGPPLPPNGPPVNNWGAPPSRWNEGGGPVSPTNWQAPMNDRGHKRRLDDERQPRGRGGRGGRPWRDRGNSRGWQQEPKWGRNN